MLAMYPVLQRHISTQRFGRLSAPVAGSAQPELRQYPLSGKPKTLSPESLAHRAYFMAAQAPRFGNYTNPYYYAGDIILGAHPPDETLDRLDDWRKRILHEATKPRPGLAQGWLNPMETRFVMVDEVDLINAAARGGFMTRYPHWSHGQEFYHMYEPQRRNLSKLYELVINNNPSYAFLLDTNHEHEQEVVMAHVYGHTDFFKNNRLFQETNRQMTQQMGDHKRVIQDRYINNPQIGLTKVEDFIDKVHSIRWLVDLAKVAPRPLNFQNRKTTSLDMAEPKHEQESRGMKVGNFDLPEWMQDFVYSDKEQMTDRDAEMKRHKEQSQKIPEHPDRDVMAFLVEHGDGMESWQRDILAMLRDESYYFAPQLKTKIMNEGWATFWHTRLTEQVPSLIDAKNIIPMNKMKAGVLQANPQQLNPYLIGYTLFKDIYKRWSTGRHDDNPEYHNLKNLAARKTYNNGAGEVAGIQKIQEVRTVDSDVDFLRKYLTEDVVQKLGMYNTESEDEADGGRKFISSKEFEEVRERLLESLTNGGQPQMEVLDGNYNNNKELRLRHIHTYDLKADYAETTLAYIQQMWGHTVHLDTAKFDGARQTKTLMRITAEPVWDNGKRGVRIRRYRLLDTGNPAYEVDRNGKKI